MENSKMVEIDLKDNESLKVGEMKGKQQKMMMENMVMNKVVAEKYWKSLVIGWIKREKVKSLLIAQSRSTRLKLWALGATTLLLLFACLVQLSTLSPDVRPRVLMFRSSHQDDYIPPPPQSSEYIF